MDDVRKWFMDKYLSWQRDLGELKDQTEFASYLGFPQSTVSLWISGGRKPGKMAAEKIYNKTHDPTIFDVCGFVRPVEEWEDIPTSKLPLEIRTKLDAAVAEINAIYLARSIQSESPEALTIATEVMSRHGFTWRETV